MSSARVIEVSGGTATALFGLLNTLLALRVARPQGLEYLMGFVLWLLPGLLVAVGAYNHAIKQRPWGRLMLWVGGLFLVLTFCVFLFGGGFYYGLKTGLLLLAPGSMAIVTLLASLKTSAKISLQCEKGIPEGPTTLPCQLNSPTSRGL
jgi:hypothetical protein